MSSRRKSRIIAMQLLYQIQLTDAPVQDVINRFWQNHGTPTEFRPFATMLVQNTVANREAIDAVIQATSKNWKLHRMPVVDLSILRCATYEILYCEEIDAATSINEAVEIAKTYSTPDSPKFVNGILDNIRKKASEFKRGSVQCVIT